MPCSVAPAHPLTLAAKYCRPRGGAKSRPGSMPVSIASTVTLPPASPRGTWSPTTNSSGKRAVVVDPVGLVVVATCVAVDRQPERTAPLISTPSHRRSGGRFCGPSVAELVAIQEASASQMSWRRGWSLLSRIDAVEDRFDPPLVGGSPTTGGVTVEDGEAGAGRSSLQIDDPGRSAFPGGHHDRSRVTHDSQSGVGRADIDQLSPIGGRVAVEDTDEFSVVGPGGGCQGGIDGGVVGDHAFHGKAR